MTHPDFSAFPGAEDWSAAGLTKREYFAALALQGLLANPELTQLKAELAASVSVDHANALIAALNRQEARP